MKEKKVEKRQYTQMKNSETLLREARKKDRTSKSDVSALSLLREFFSKEQFIDELLTLRKAKPDKLQQWDAEEEHKKSTIEKERGRYRLLEETMSEVMLLLDASFCVVYCTSSIESLTGHKREEIVSMRLEKLLTPPSLQVFMERLTDALVAHASGFYIEARTCELELYSKKGGFVTGTARIKLGMGEDREPAEVIVLIDNPGDKKLWEKLLWQTKEQHRILFEQTKEPAYFVDADGRFLDANPAWLDWLGYTRDEIVGTDLRQVFSLPSKHPLYHHRAEGKEVREFRARLRQKSGVEQECAITAAAWRGQTGELLGYLGIVSTKDGRKNRIDGKEGRRGELMAAMAHEIKKPVGVVLQGLEEVHKLISDPAARVVVEKIGQAAARVSRVMDSVLDLYRGSPSAAEEADITTVNSEVISIYDDEIRARNISVITDLPPDLPRVKLNSDILSQIISNVLSNSLAAMPRSGVITVGAEKHSSAEGGAHICLIYADTGSGMTQNDLRKVFEPFFTTKSHLGGIGLGLTLSREMIERIGGTITVDSVVGQGTTVRMVLPACRR